MSAAEAQAFSAYGWVVCIWVLLVSFQASALFSVPAASTFPALTRDAPQYGFHISSLNQLQAVLTCRVGIPAYYYKLPTCIPMDDATFSLVTAVYTVGGFFGSAVAGTIMDGWGRKGAVLSSSFIMALGSGFMGVSASLSPLIFGRYVFRWRPYLTVRHSLLVQYQLRRVQPFDWRRCWYRNMRRSRLHRRDCTRQN